MPNPHLNEQAFLQRITEVVDLNIANEQFGVSELADEIGMSRSNLLRKIKKITGLSVSQFIRNNRLERAKQILTNEAVTVSEVSYQVGFNSVSYFIKCFGDLYGYPPGEVGQHEETTENATKAEQTGLLIEPQSSKRPGSLIVILLIVALAAALILIFQPFSGKKSPMEKSIAVLPFINDSNDSTNLYIINGLMESVLSNLQQIVDLRVISRTSVEKFRNHTKTIPEIAKELDVSYFVEGSGQKIGDRILLHIQLIEAKSDKHLWASDYKRSSKDIFELQQEIARDIAHKVEAVITPEEKTQIAKKPTEDLVAYDYFLKGQELMFRGGYDKLPEAIDLFQKAVKQDPNFANAWADIAITYFLLDVNQTEKKYADQINSYADKALLCDPKLPQSLIAKALYHLNIREYQKTITYLEKALEYNPNSAVVTNTLADVYNNYLPNTEKYLEYAIKGVRLDIAGQDSTTASYLYLNIGNALIQTGFIEEALYYINQSIKMDPNNLYSEYVKEYIQFSQNHDLKSLVNKLLATYKKDTNRLDVIQEVGKIYYYLGDYTSSYFYYSKFLAAKSQLHLNIYPGETAKIAYVLSKIGMEEESARYFEEYRVYAEQDQTIYKNLSLAVWYIHQGDIQKALEHLDLFSQEDHYHYWIILFIQMDPLLDPILDLPEGKRLLKVIENKFWINHDRIKSQLVEKNLL